MSRESLGMMTGLIFCFLSGAFDVVVSHITQSLNPMVIGFYCFTSTTLLFGLSKTRANLHLLQQKVKMHLGLVILLNISVVMTWGGLFYALKFLEPAVVGILSVAMGPSLTIAFSLFHGDNKITNDDKVISAFVLLIVLIILCNSFLGHSGVNGTSILERSLGIGSILICSIGTVSYTFTSKALSNKGWYNTELLAVRNILMVFVSLLIVYTNNISLFIGEDFLVVISLLIFGHILTIYLFQKAVTMISPLQISMVLLSLPVFTLLLQYVDARIYFSVPTIVSTALILILMSLSIIMKIYKKA